MPRYVLKTRLSRQVKGALHHLRGQRNDGVCTQKILDRLEAHLEIMLEEFLIEDKPDIYSDDVLNSILKMVCRHYKMPVELVVSKRKTREVTKVRCACVHVMLESTGRSLSQIGKFFGRNHSIIIYMRDEGIPDKLKAGILMKSGLDALCERGAQIAADRFTVKNLVTTVDTLADVG